MLLGRGQLKRFGLQSLATLGSLLGSDDIGADQTRLNGVI